MSDGMNTWHEYKHENLCRHTHVRLFRILAVASRRVVSRFTAAVASSRETQRQMQGLTDFAIAR